MAEDVVIRRGARQRAKLVGQGDVVLEDYGDRVPLILLGARGERALSGLGALEADFVNRPYYLRAVETYTRIDRQAALFARGEMKPVAYIRAHVERDAVRRYRPGAE
jgi:hypothetical protein